MVRAVLAALVALLLVGAAPTPVPHLPEVRPGAAAAADVVAWVPAVQVVTGEPGEVVAVDLALDDGTPHDVTARLGVHEVTVDPRSGPAPGGPSTAVTLAVDELTVAAGDRVVVRGTAVVPEQPVLVAVTAALPAAEPADEPGDDDAKAEDAGADAADDAGEGGDAGAGETSDGDAPDAGDAGEAGRTDDAGPTAVALVLLGPASGPAAPAAAPLSVSVALDGDRARVVVANPGPAPALFDLRLVDAVWLGRATDHTVHDLVVGAGGTRVLDLDLGAGTGRRRVAVAVAARGGPERTASVAAWTPRTVPAAVALVLLVVAGAGVGAARRRAAS